MNQDKLTTWLTDIITGLVSNPNEVSVIMSEDEQGVLFTVSVAPEDNGKIIGKKGAIAQAIRTILRSAGYMCDLRVSMKIC